MTLKYNKQDRGALWLMLLMLAGWAMYLLRGNWEAAVYIAFSACLIGVNHINESLLNRIINEYRVLVAVMRKVIEQKSRRDAGGTQ